MLISETGLGGGAGRRDGKDVSQRAENGSVAVRVWLHNRSGHLSTRLAVPEEEQRAVVVRKEHGHLLPAGARCRREGSVRLT